jgi:hypothetical protein
LLREQIFGEVLTEVLRHLFFALDALDPHHPAHASARSSSGELTLGDEIALLEHMEMPEAVVMHLGDRQVLPTLTGPSQSLRERFKPPGNGF